MSDKKQENHEKHESDDEHAEEVKDEIHELGAAESEPTLPKVITKQTSVLSTAATVDSEEGQP